MFWSDARKRAFFLKGADVNKKDTYGRTPLHLAVRANNKKMVRFFLSLHADVNIPDVDNMTAMHAAAIGGNLEIVQDLLKANADVNVQNTRGSTPLALVFENEHFEYGYFEEECFAIVEALLNAGSDVNLSRHRTETPLHQAIRKKYNTILKLLLAKGGSAKESLCITAVCFKNTKAVPIVLEAGVRLDATDEYNLHDVAIRNFDLKGVKNLVQAGIKLYQQNFKVALECGRTDIVQFFLDQGFSPNTVFSEVMRDARMRYDNFANFRDTALHVTVDTKRDNLEVMSLLLEAGANINAKNHDELTPLYLAIRQGHWDQDWWIVRNYVFLEPSGVRLLCDRPEIQLNGIGPGSLLAFFDNKPAIVNYWRSKGVFEMRGTNEVRRLLAHDTAHSNTQVVESFQQSVARLKVGKLPDDIKAAYRALKDFLSTEDFEQIILGISQTNNWYWEQDRPVFKAAIEACTPHERLVHLRREIPGLFRRMESPHNSPDIRVAFLETAGLMWLALQEDNKLLIPHPPNATDLEKQASITTFKKDTLQLFLQRLFSFQYEHYHGGPLVAARPACTIGTVHHLLSSFNGLHADVTVTFLRVGPAYQPDAALPDRVHALMPALVAKAYHQDLLEWVSARSSLELSDEAHHSFFDTGFIANARHLALAQKVLGRLKNTVQWKDYNVEPTQEATRYAFIALEDLMRFAPLGDWLQWVYSAKGYAAALLAAPKRAPILDTWEFHTKEQLQEQAWFCQLTAKQKEKVMIKLGKQAAQPGLLEMIKDCFYNRSQNNVTGASLSEEFVLSAVPEPLLLSTPQTPLSTENTNRVVRRNRPEMLV